MVLVFEFVLERANTPDQCVEVAQVGEVAHPVSVRLERQVFPAQASAPLRPGLRVQADLMMEQRRLWEWMLEPLLTAAKAVKA